MISTGCGLAGNDQIFIIIYVGIVDNAGGVIIILF
jgi:hypothetical protein